MGIDRRMFLRGLGAGIAGLVPGSFLLPARASAGKGDTKKQFRGVLVDTTRCVGCRNCELACAEAHNMPIPDISLTADLDKIRPTSETKWTLVNRYKTSRGEVFVKRQCMHCNQPGCVAACLVKAMRKREEGAVTWDGNCMGCRYCMISCPFDIPQFEYYSWNPRILKCNLCYERTQEGKQPACVEACPAEALTFGPRSKLIEEANTRIYQNRDSYHNHIYGEYEVGGSSYLYLSAVPFEEIGFRTDLGTTAYPKYTTGFLYSVPVVLLLWPAFLLGVSQITKREEVIKSAEGKK